jgi:hypothetical protein
MEVRNSIQPIKLNLSSGVLTLTNKDKEKMANSTRPLNEPVTAAALQELAEVSLS